MRRLDVVLKVAVLIGMASSAAALSIGFWIPVKAEVAQILLEHAWRQAQAGSPDPRPWPWADTSPVARLTIPSLDASWVVLSGASGRNLAFAPSHMDGSAEPGRDGVTVIAGHRDTHFSALEKIARGDEIVLEDRAGAIHRYRVSRIEIVDATKMRIRLDSDRPMLVLTTCFPFDAVAAGGPLRFLVEADVSAM
jgi:sortase A